MASAWEDQKIADSCLLYQLCCDVGFSREAWLRRLHCSDMDSTGANFLGTFVRKYRLKFLYSGSSSEGVAADILGSDTDIMVVLPGTRVIEGDQVSLEDPNHVYQIVPSIHPAFVRLKLLHSADQTRNRQLFPTPRCCVIDDTGTLVFSPLLLKRSANLPMGNGLNDFTRHGPALTTSMDLQAEREYDFVVSLHCDDWPSVSAEWVHRKRRFGWPTQNLIQEVTQQGCELVPVGNSESPGKDFEWRLSSSLAEKILVRAFNIVQIQCYFLLKLVLVFLIKPIVKNGLCSYHMKTVVLHVMEETDPREWREDNLIICFMKCMRTLLDFLERGFLPQYFIPEQNLLHPKVQGETLYKTIDVVRDLHTEGWRCVLKCVPFTNQNLFCSHLMPRCPCYIEYWRMHGMYMLKADPVLRSIRQMLKICNEIVSSLSVMGLQETVKNLMAVKTSDWSTDMTSFQSQFLIEAVTKLVANHIGFICLNALRRKRKTTARKLYKILSFSLRSLEKGSSIDVTSCRLKIATFFYQTGQLYKCVNIVTNVLQDYHDNTLSVCGDDYRYLSMNSAVRDLALRRLLPLIDDTRAFVSHMAFPVTFSPLEMITAPREIQELAVSRQLVTPRDHEFRNMLFLDPLVYAYYLLVVSYRELGIQAEVERSLMYLKRIVSDSKQHVLYYPEISSQLVALCTRG